MKLRRQPQPLNHHMPRDQQQFDSPLERMRSYAHIAERTPGNSGGIFMGQVSEAARRGAPCASRSPNGLSGATC
eukprot:1028692-Pyramimonas_sp.AAC.1